MKKIYALTLLLIFIVLTTHAQTFYQKTISLARKPNTWTGGTPYIAKQTADMGIIFTGSYYYNGVSDSNTFVIKLDANLAVQWSVGLYVATNPKPYAIVQTRDLGYLIAGTYNVTGGSNAFIIKLNKNGKLLWEKHLQQAAFTAAFSATEDRAGNIFVSGKSDDGSASDLWVTKLTRSGTITLNKVYDVPGYNVYENKIVSSKDNGFAIVGSTGSNSLVMKADTLGIPIWTKVLGEQLQSYNMDISEASNRDLTVVATRSSDALALQLNKDGNSKWSKSISNTGSVAVSDLLQLSSGNLLLSATAGGSPNQVSLLKLDNATGNLVIGKNFNPTDGEIFNVINKISETEYSISGWDASAGTNYISLSNFDSSLQNCTDEAAGYTIADHTLTTANATATETSTLTEVAVTTSGSPWTNATTVALPCENVLPLNLLRFTLAKNGSSNVLSWSTSEEINTSYFEIQRGINNTSFSAIGKVTAGKNKTQNDYQYTDAQPLNGTNYYRLKIVDADGRFTYSPILLSSNNKSLDIAVWPNPVKDKIVLSINSKVKTTFNVTVTDMQGRILLSSTLNVDEGISKKELNATSLKQGTYFVRMESSEGTQIIKIIK